MQLWETFYQPKKKASGITSYITGELVLTYTVLCSRNSKSHFARNLLANRRTNLTLIVRLGTKVTC